MAQKQVEPALSKNSARQARYNPLALLVPAFRDETLPERLLKSIQDQQERSEVLISVIQLTIVSIFGLLYAIAPKTFTQDADFAPVPWVLSAYLGFSLIRL